MPVTLAMAATDRSISAVRMTKVRPTAMIPVTETWVRMLARLSTVAKDGLASAEERHQDDQGHERRDVAQLVAQERAAIDRLAMSSPASAAERSLLTVSSANSCTIAPSSSPGCGRRAPARSRARPTHHDHAMPCSRSPRTICTTSSLAPTSMPRVGSASTRTLGGQVSHLASATFCWLPPDRLRAAARPSAAGSQRLDMPAGDVAPRPGPQQQAADALEHADRHVLVDRLGGEQHRAPALRHQRDAGAPGLGGAARPQDPAADRHGARVGPSLPISARASSIWPEPMKP